MGLSEQAIRCHRCRQLFWDTRGQSVNGQVCWECDLRAEVDRDKPELPTDAETEPSLWLRASTEVVCWLPVAVAIFAVVALIELEWFRMLLMALGVFFVGGMTAKWAFPLIVWRDRRLGR